MIQKTQASIFPGVPTLYTAINHHPDVKKFALGSVRLCLSGAAPLPLEVAETFEKLTGGRLVEGFGMTECSPVAIAQPALRDAARRKHRASRCRRPTRRSSTSRRGRRLGVGQDGELAIKGPQVMLGYWGRPDETTETIKDGWLHTGDIAKMDADGFIFIVDRKKDMISASGLKVLPREVEEVLFLHPKVEEAVVAGVPGSVPRRDGQGVRRAEGGHQPHGRGADRVLQAPPGLVQGSRPRSSSARSCPKSMVGKVLAPRLGRRGKGQAGGDPRAHDVRRRRTACRWVPRSHSSLRSRRRS